MKRFPFTFLVLLYIFLGGCSIQDNQDFPKDLGETTETIISSQDPFSISKMPLSESTVITDPILLGTEEMLVELTDHSYEIQIKQITIPEYNIKISYLSPASIEYDQENAHWIEDDTINPQGRPNYIFTDEPIISSLGKEFQACFFTPIAMYQFSGTIEEVIKYFAEKDQINYLPLKSMEMLEHGVWGKWGMNRIRGNSFIQKVNNQEILFWEAEREIKLHIGDKYYVERYLFYNPNTPHRIYKIETSGGDCNYPQISTIDFVVSFNKKIP